MDITPTPTISTQLFRFFTARDADTVWRALTAASGPHLYGAPIVSGWHAGSTLELRAPVGPPAVGKVVAAEPGRRLTHTLGDRLDAPAVYVSWTLHPADDGTVVRLYVDEIDGGRSDALDMEVAWLAIVAALQHHLERSTTVPD